MVSERGLFSSKTIDVDGVTVEVNKYPDGHLQILARTPGYWFCRDCAQYLWRGELGVLDRLANPRRWFRSEEQEMWVLIRRCARRHATRCQREVGSPAWDSLPSESRP